MKKILIILFTFISISVFSQADLIVYNANIYTMDNDKGAQAIAIKGNKIYKIGFTDEILKLRSKKTKIINAQGKSIIPGLFDSHLHVIRGGRFFNTELRWDGVRSLKKALQMLKEQAQRTPKGQWVRVVGGWNAYQFEEKRLPTLEEINESTANTPAFLLHLYGHAYLNKVGLQALKINSKTPNPNGGLIQKDEQGNPTGLLIAEPNAYILYSTLAKLPELNEEEKTNSTKNFISDLNRFGITAVMDAGGGFQNFPNDYGITDILSKKSELTVRLPFYLFAQKAGNEFQDYSKWINSVEIGQSCEDETKRSKFFGKTNLEYYVQGGGENLVASAADFENFDEPRPNLSPQMETQLKEVLTSLIKNRWPFRIHATYNESITRFLNVIEEIDKQYPLNGLLWFFDHAETISEENLQRVKKLNGGIAIQFRMAFQGESFIKRYGIDAVKHTPPVKRMLELGIKVGMGSDGTRVSSYNPWIGMYWLTTGKTMGKTKIYDKDNIIDRKTALQLYTKGSAELINLQNDRGTLKEGYLADFVILNEDYFKVSDDDILKLKAIVTVVDGKLVYSDGTISSELSHNLKGLPDWSPVNFYGGYQIDEK